MTNGIKQYTYVWLRALLYSIWKAIFWTLSLVIKSEKRTPKQAYLRRRMGSTQKQLQMQQTTTLHFEERELAAAVVHDYIFLNKLKKKIKNNRLRKKSTIRK